MVVPLTPLRGGDVDPWFVFDLGHMLADAPVSISKDMPDSWSVM